MKNLYNIIFMAGAGLLLLGAVLQITRWDFAPFIYTVGAVMFGYVQGKWKSERYLFILRRS